jgi:death-on-curing protein
MEPQWLTIEMVFSIHAQTIRIFGGSAGVRDTGLLKSALERARNLLHYGESPSLFDLAAIYCTGIVKNHPFVDGNKRTGILCANAFLELNGYRFEPEEVDVVSVIMALADGTADEAILSKWLSDYSRPKKA